MDNYTAPGTFAKMYKKIADLESQLVETQQALSERTRERDEIRRTAKHQGSENVKINKENAVLIDKVAELKEVLRYILDHVVVPTKIDLMIEIVLKEDTPNAK